MKSTSKPLTYRIGDIARKLGISVETIRMYEREGILLTRKTENGQRIFTGSDLHWLGCIRRLIKAQGLNIEGIRRMVALMPCWEMRPCTAAEQSACPAYHGGTQPCWMIKEQVPMSCRAKDCRLCNVYRGATSCVSLKQVIYHEGRG